jgi:hypothetical protein
MTDPKPPHPWMPLQIVASLRKGAAKRRNRDSSTHSCMDIAGHAGLESII